MDFPGRADVSATFTHQARSGALNVGGLVPHLSRGAQRCLDLLKWYSARFRDVYPLQSTIAKNLGKKERQVRNYLSELKAAGLLQIKRDGPNPALYVLIEQQPTAKNCRSFAAQIAAHLPLKRRASIYESSCFTQERVWPEQPRKPPNSETAYMTTEETQRFLADLERSQAVGQ